MLKKLYPLILIAVLAALLLAGCAPQTKYVTLVAKDIEWEMETITAEPGQEIELTIRNDGALDHNFVIEELDIDILLSPGDAEIVNFTIEEPSTIAYICNVPGHEEAGMVGEIVIGDGQ